MKVTIEFKLPEEQEELDLVNKVNGMHCSLAEFFQLLRKMDKYEEFGSIKHVYHDDGHYIALDDVRDAFLGILDANEILSFI